jgi:thiol-disulfide isomerase/thioredoxin
MKFIFFVFAFIILSIELIAQDTIVNMDGSIEVFKVRNIDSSWQSGITDKIQELKFVTLENNIVQIDSNNSKCFVINIWATYCSPCVAEIPILNKLMSKYKECDIDFYALSYFEDSTSTKKFLESHSYNFKQVLASRDYVKENKLSVGLPTTLFCDKKGNVLFKITGGIEDPDKQEATINRFIKGMNLIGCH